MWGVQHLNEDYRTPTMLNIVHIQSNSSNVNRCYVCASYTLYRRLGSPGGVYQVYDTTEHCHHIKQVIRTYNIVYNSTSSEFVRIFNPQRRKTNNFFEQILSFWKFQYPQTLQKNSSRCWRGRYPRNTDTWYTKLNNIVYVCGVCNVWIRIIGRQQCCILWI